MPSSHPYDKLTPDTILDAVEACDITCSGSLLALNSYENRVYRIEKEEGGYVAAKFYRPDRWGDDTIAEEHQFALELFEHEIPIVAPMVFAQSRTIRIHQGFRFALFPWQPGRAPELNHSEDRKLLGRYLGRLHTVGASGSFAHRTNLTLEDFGKQSVIYLLSQGMIPDYLETAYRSLTEQLLARLDETLLPLQSSQRFRLHGDCHLSNILWTDTGPHFVDLDDCLTGPAIQDMWMLLSGSRDDQQRQLADLLQGYTQFRDFDPSELQLIESLRTLRMLNYSAWLARRWQDPAFPRNFPWFNTIKYWEEQVLSLREQQAALEEPPLVWLP